MFNDTNEFIEEDGRYYVNPDKALAESNSFIDKLRSTQQANNEQIQTQTYNLGTAVPSQIGGLGAPNGAGMSYFTSRLQTPQTASAVANLRATAQAAALNQALQNEQAKWQKRYQDAYRNYQRRSSGGGGGGELPETTGGVDEAPTNGEIVDGLVPSVPGYAVVGDIGLKANGDKVVRGYIGVDENGNNYYYDLNNQTSTNQNRNWLENPIDIGSVLTTF